MAIEVYLTEADGYPVQGVWSTFELAKAQLVDKFGIDTDELIPDKRETDVWSAPGDMGMMKVYITKKTVDQE